ncbi:MAG: aldehyde ferredoxin oxidoreductase N-terminal domain-containing protein [Deferrisomatales bacterium]
MIRDHFRVLVADLGSGRGRIETVDGRDEMAGGSGLAALLFARHARFDRPWDDPEQPLIFAIGPLTGYFPMMSKTVCAFRSPYHDQYAESHAGGRSALALRFADLDALVVTGKAARPTALGVGSRSLEFRDVSFLWGADVSATGKLLRRTFPGSGHRSLWRIGPAGEAGSAMACINVDSYRHFGRLGGGAAMGAKNLKAVAVIGDASFPLPEGAAYPKLVQELHRQINHTELLAKYHDLGTAANVAGLNELGALPWRNLQQTRDPGAEAITGERFAEATLLRNQACAGCPVGCIHVGYVREPFAGEHHYLYRQVSYDYEPIFAVGSMLGVTNPFQVLALCDVVEKLGLDVMSAGVALAWATEALAAGLVTEGETLVALRFGEAEGYKAALRHLGTAANEFYRLLGLGTLKAAARYGGRDFACVLGQEMGGYATGELYFAAQALGLRMSHLDTGAYAYEQKHAGRDADRAVEFLVRDEGERCLLTSMVACLFARAVYTEERIGECLRSLGYGSLAGRLPQVSARVQELRWQNRFATGFDPAAVAIPKRFTEVENWKGPIDLAYLAALLTGYGRRIAELGGPKP